MTISTPVKRILLVDDEADFLKISHEVLDDFFGKQVEIFQAKDGQEGLEKLIEQKIDLLITDLKMPRVDGDSLIEMTHRLVETKRPKHVIVLSSQLPENPSHPALTYLSKPLDKKILQATVSTILSLKMDSSKVIDSLTESIVDLLSQKGFSAYPDRINSALLQEASFPRYLSAFTTASLNETFFSISLSFEQDCPEGIPTNTDKKNFVAELLNQTLADSGFCFSPSTIVVGHDHLLEHEFEGMLISRTFSCYPSFFHLGVVLKEQHA